MTEINHAVLQCGEVFAPIQLGKETTEGIKAATLRCMKMASWLCKNISNAFKTFAEIC